MKSKEARSERQHGAREVVRVWLGVRGANTLCFVDRMLAFLFYLCLAVVGVVGQLTDADFAKIGYLLTSELDKRDVRLYAMFDALNTTLSNKIDLLDTKIDDIKNELSKHHFFNLQPHSH